MRKLKVASNRNAVLSGRLSKAKPSAAGARPTAPPTWEEGFVNPQKEHFELRYGERHLPVARVGRDQEKRIFVQFLDKKRNDNSRTRAITSAVSGEVTHYFFGAVGSDGWAFARFHCETPANLASQIHWSWQPGE